MITAERVEALEREIARLKGEISALKTAIRKRDNLLAHAEKVRQKLEKSLDKEDGTK